MRFILLLVISLAAAPAFAKHADQDALRQHCDQATQTFSMQFALELALGVAKKELLEQAELEVPGFSLDVIGRLLDTVLGRDQDALNAAMSAFSDECVRFNNAHPKQI